MKLFLILALLSSSSIVLAQESEEPSLFPELSAYKNETSEKAAIPTIQNDDLSNNISDAEKPDSAIEEDLFAPSQQEDDSLKNVPQKQEEPKEEEEEEEDDQKQQIVMTLNDVKATLTPNRNASYCSAVFAVANGLKKELKAFAGTITIGKSTKKFNFQNIAKQNVFASKYLFLGNACEQILDEPKIDIQKCQVENWSEKKCKEKIIFIPIPKNEQIPTR